MRWTVSRCYILLMACARSDQPMLCSLRARLLSRLQMTSSQQQWSTKSAGDHWQTQGFLN